MRTDSRLQPLLDILEQPSSTCVLGAGVSFPFVPLVAGFSASVRRRVLEVGCFPAEPIEHDEVSLRILGPRRRTGSLLDDNVLLEEDLVYEHVAPTAVRAATVALLRPIPPAAVPVQYGFFNLARHRLSLINFNNDGFAYEFCNHHALTHPHGSSLSAADRGRYDWENLIDACQEYPDLSDVAPPGLLLPQKEPLEIAGSRAFATMHQFLNGAKHLAIIGYSFCEKDDEMDDWMSYRMVVSAIKSRDIPVTAVAPNARELAVRLQHDSGKNSINAIATQWKELSSAVLISTDLPRFKACTHSRLCSRCVAYYNEFLLDGGARARSLQSRASRIAIAISPS